MTTTTRIYLTSLLMDATFFCAWAAVPFLVRADPAFNLDDSEIGLVRAASSITYVLGSFTLTGFFGRRSRSRTAKAAAAVTGLTMLLASMVRSTPLLVACLVLGSLSLSVFWPNLMALVGEVQDKSLVKRLATFNCWWSIGKASAFLFAGSLLEAFDDKAVSLAVSGGGMFLLAFLIPRSRQTARATAEVRMEGAAPPAVEHGSEAFFRAGLFCIFAGWMIGGTFETHFPEGFGRPFFGPVFGESYEFGSNVLLFLLVFGQALGFFLMRWRAGWTSRRGLFLLAAFTMPAVQLLLLVSPREPALWAGLLLLSGMASAHVYAQSLFHAQAGRADKVRRSGIHEGVLSLGSLFGALGTGFALQSTKEPTVALQVMAVTAITVALLAAFVLCRRVAAPGRTQFPNANMPSSPAPAVGSTRSTGARSSFEV